MMMNRKEIFTAAHKIAKAIRKDCSDYRTAFSCALRAVYEGYTMEEKTTVQKLEDLGIEAWERGSMKRYYINENNYEAVFGLKIWRYNSGNICGAELNGESLSNTKAGRLLRNKFFFDAVDNTWKMSGTFCGTCELCEELSKNIRI